VKFERGQLVNYILFTKPGKRTLRPAIVVKEYPDTHDRRNMELYEVYDIANGDNHIVAHWSLEA
tara:strand:- start:1137 stop:1328 length:192 start_codon:yes stop_codon:yes gene_type:complete